MVSINSDVAFGVKQNMTRVLNTNGNFKIISTSTKSLGPDARANGVFKALKKSNPNSAESKQDFLDNLYKSLSAQAPKELSFNEKNQWILAQLNKNPNVATEIRALSDKIYV